MTTETSDTATCDGCGNPYLYAEGRDDAQGSRVCPSCQSLSAREDATHRAESEATMAADAQARERVRVEDGKAWLVLSSPLDLQKAQESGLHVFEMPPVPGSLESLDDVALLERSLAALKAYPASSTTAHALEAETRRRGPERLEAARKALGARREQQ